MEPIEDDPHLAALAELLAVQARDLNRIFARAFGDMLLGKTRSLRDIGRALKAQNQCRIALRLLLALRAAAEKKSRNRTNGLLEKENRRHTKTLDKPPEEKPLVPGSNPDSKEGGRPERQHVFDATTIIALAESPFRRVEAASSTIPGSGANLISVCPNGRARTSLSRAVLERPAKTQDGG